jgi:hypothetical protein
MSEHLIERDLSTYIRNNISNRSYDQVINNLKLYITEKDIKTLDELLKDITTEVNVASKEYRAILLRHIVLDAILGTMECVIDEFLEKADVKEKGNTISN